MDLNNRIQQILIKEILNKLVCCVVRQACPELSRRAQDERQMVDFVRGEPFGSAQDRLVEGLVQGFIKQGAFAWRFCWDRWQTSDVLINLRLES